MTQRWINWLRDLFRENRKILNFISIVILLSILLIIWGIADKNIDYIHDFSANWVSTMLGALVGVPVALWVSRYQEHRAEVEKKEKILVLLEKELKDNKGFLQYWNDEKRVDQIETLYTLLRDEAWKAFSDGGELQWIKNPELLRTLAEAFSSIGKVIEISRMYYDRVFMVGQVLEDAHREAISERFIEALELAQDDINKALEKI